MRNVLFSEVLQLLSRNISAARVALSVEARKMTRTDFEQFLLWEGVMVLKELILNSF